MLFRIYIGLVLLLGLYFVYDTAQVLFAKSAAHKAEASYSIETDTADLTVVEFLDYGCAPCRDLHPPLMRALKNDGKIRFIPRPVGGTHDETGTQAALLAYAAGRQGKFIEAHNALIENFRPINAEYISNLALEIGLDTQKLEQDMQDPNLAKTVESNRKTLETLKGRSVPTLFIGKRLLLPIAGATPTTDVLLSIFDKGRML